MHTVLDEQVEHPLLQATHYPAVYEFYDVNVVVDVLYYQ